MQLLPYLYSTFADYYFNGTPPFRAMNLEEGFGTDIETIEKDFDATENPYSEAVKKEVKDQYMMGEFLLVAPLFNMESERKVILPKGNWYDFYTGEYVGNGEIITVSPGLDKIPVFAKDGAIIPMIQKIRQTSEWVKNTPLEIRVYGKAAGKFILYDDDGKSFNFEKGEFTTKLLKVENRKGNIEDLHNSENWSFGEIQWKFMSKD